MKKTVTVFLVLFIHTICQAQAAAELPKNWFGLFGGVNFNRLAYYDKTTTIGGNNTGFHAGIFYRKNSGKYFALQPALMISVRGGKIHEVDSTINTRLTNIELPFNFIWLHKGFIAGAGPVFCYGIKGTLNSNGQKRNAYNENESFERTVKRLELGANFIIGYQFKKRIFISSNFSPGFTNIYRGNGTAPANVRARTRTFGISVGYMFRGKS